MNILAGVSAVNKTCSDRSEANDRKNEQEFDHRNEKTKVHDELLLPSKAFRQFRSQNICLGLRETNNKMLHHLLFGRVVAFLEHPVSNARKV